ncbi:hypothetical protein ACOME3_009102 [Neoechinorhynchus agilis]
MNSSSRMMGSQARKQRKRPEKRPQQIAEPTATDIKNNDVYPVGNVQDQSENERMSSILSVNPDDCDNSQSVTFDTANQPQEDIDEYAINNQINPVDLPKTSYGEMESFKNEVCRIYKDNLIYYASHLVPDPQFLFPENVNRKSPAEDAAEKKKENDQVKKAEMAATTAVTSDVEHSGKQKKNKKHQPILGNQIYRMNRHLAQATRMVIRFFYPNPEVWVVSDYLLMYPNIRDFDLAEKCGLDIRSVRKAVAYLIKDKMVTTKIRAVKVQISDEEAKSRKRPLPANGMKQQRHTFYQLYPHCAANAVRIKLVRMRRELDEASIDPDEAGLPEGIELWFTCPYCMYKITNLQADIALAAGVLTGERDDMPCPMCDTIMNQNTEGNERIRASRKTMAVFNKKLKKVLDRLFKKPTVAYPNDALNMRFLEGEDLTECTLFLKQTKSAKKAGEKVKEEPPENNIVIVFKSEFDVANPERRLRQIPPWFQRRQTGSSSIPDGEGGAVDEDSNDSFEEIVCVDPFEATQEFRDIYQMIEKYEKNPPVEPKVSDVSFKCTYPPVPTLRVEGDVRLQVNEVTSSMYYKFDEVKKNDFLRKYALYNKILGIGIMDNPIRSIERRNRHRPLYSLCPRGTRSSNKS